MGRQSCGPSTGRPGRDVGPPAPRVVVYAKGLIPLPDAPVADDAVEHERIVLGELLGGLAAREDRHRAFAREIVLPRLAPVPTGEEPT